MSALDRNRWIELWRESRAPTEASAWYDELMRLYTQPHRHYHNWQHILDCLNQFDSARHLARQPIAVELAIWFHDAIYDPRAADNEEKSADLATSCIADIGLAEKYGASVAQLVLATKHHDGSLTEDAPLMVDIDLSILGRSPVRFSDFEQEIRKEYAWVPEDVFSAKRAEVLEGFLTREKIYNLEFFFQRYERQARVNLSACIHRLRGG